MNKLIAFFSDIQKVLIRLYQRFSAAVQKKPLPVCIPLAFILNLLIECFSRHSLTDGIAFLIFHPYLFSINTLILFLTLSISLLFSRRSFVLSVISIIWLTLGITNCVILGMRNTPLAAIDFGLALSCISIITVYLNLFQIFAICAALILVVLLLIKLFQLSKPMQTEKSAYLHLRGFLSFFTVTMASIIVLFLSVKTGALHTDFADLPGAYNDYGFVYCFSLSLFDRGVDRPVDYGVHEIDSILSTIDSSESTDSSTQDTTKTPTENSDFQNLEQVTKTQPNIIFVQLESFFDVNRLQGITFSENPVPVFTALKDTCSSGYLTVPSIGAGTANTEFEILTGMNLDDFGAGEYPYKTVLREQTCESIPNNLRTLGYTSHAVHNNTATFYDRNHVYASLGFDTFLPLEYMEDVTYNPLGWAKDSILTAEIGKCLDSTPGSDFVFAVSVQPHGKYPDDENSADNPDAYDTVSLLDRIFGDSDDLTKQNGGNLTGDVTVTLTDEQLEQQKIEVYGISDEKLAAQYRYYVNQIYETDAFLGALTKALSARSEPTVLVLYGDHLPCFHYTNESMADHSTPYQTEYVIWSNFGLEAVDCDLEAYQLSASVLGRLDIHAGILTRLHQRCSSDREYLSSLKMLEYDMLYGDMRVWGGINPYLPTVVKMGINEIRITNVQRIGTAVYLSGEHFTKFSTVMLNNKPCDTIYIDENTLMLSSILPASGDRISVAQIGNDGVILSESNTIYIIP